MKLSDKDIKKIYCVSLAINKVLPFAILPLLSTPFPFYKHSFPPAKKKLKTTYLPYVKKFEHTDDTIWELIITAYDINGSICQRTAEHISTQQLIDLLSMGRKNTKPHKQTTKRIKKNVLLLIPKRTTRKSTKLLPKNKRKVVGKQVVRKRRSI